MTPRERAQLTRAADAFADGDTELALALLDQLLDDPPLLAGQCEQCGRWPGERWQCGPCSELARAA